MYMYVHVHQHVCTCTSTCLLPGIGIEHEASSSNISWSINSSIWAKYGRVAWRWAIWNAWLPRLKGTELVTTNNNK